MSNLNFTQLLSKCDFKSESINILVQTNYALILDAIQISQI